MIIARLVQLEISSLVIIQIFAQAKLGRVLPIPLTRFDDDPQFSQCPADHGIYAHTKNCSLFHLCTFGEHQVYSCFNGFFYNPISKRCQYWSSNGQIHCQMIIEDIMEKNFYPIDEFINDSNQTDYRKSLHSDCIQSGIYPDIFDCSLFHLCHPNGYHQIHKCPDGLHLDPKTLICLNSQLVDCQYEPSINVDSSSLFDKMCRNAPIDTFLPIRDKSDEFLICEETGRIVRMKCKSGFIYNALTTSCENGPCTFDSTLCQNEGQCIDEPNVSKGFQCLCSHPFHGEFCEKSDRLTEETTHQNTIELSSQDQWTRANNRNETTHIPFIDQFNSLQSNKSISLHQSFDDDYSDDDLPQYQELIKIILFLICCAIVLLMIISIGYVIWRWIKFNVYPPIDSVSQWKILAEESKV